MEYIKIRVETTKEGLELVCGALYQCGLSGAMIDDAADFEAFINDPNRTWDYIDDGLRERKEAAGTAVTFFVTDNAYGMEQLSQMKSALVALKQSETEFDLGALSCISENVREEDWANNWKKYFKPFPVGKRMLIKPSWEEAPEAKGRILLEIDPGHVFGTGTHETTKLCIEAIEKSIKEKDKVLDIGCGSGILSIASILYGAAFAEAVDIDPNAIEIAYENAARNGIGHDKLRVTSGNILEEEQVQLAYRGGQFDLVVSNIVADVIIALAKPIPQWIRRGGIWIASGVILERLEEVKEAIQDAGFIILEIQTEKDWAVLISRYMGEGV